MPRRIEVESLGNRTTGPFSDAVSAGDLIFVSGQASVSSDGKIIEDSFRNEMLRSFDNVKSVLQRCGLTLEDVVSTRAYVQNPADLDEYNTLYRDVFAPPYPARTTLVGCLAEGLKFEVDVIAARNSSDEQFFR